jgi:hypothetical protein
MSLLLGSSCQPYEAEGLGEPDRAWPLAAYACDVGGRGSFFTSGSCRKVRAPGLFSSNSIRTFISRKQNFRRCSTPSGLRCVRNTPYFSGNEIYENSR